jgi:hypothetical protein
MEASAAKRVDLGPRNRCTGIVAAKTMGSSHAELRHYLN